MSVAQAYQIRHGRGAILVPRTQLWALLMPCSFIILTKRPPTPSADPAPISRSPCSPFLHQPPTGLLPCALFLAPGKLWKDRSLCKANTPVQALTAMYQTPLYYDSPSAASKSRWGLLVPCVAVTACYAEFESRRIGVLQAPSTSHMIRIDYQVWLPAFS